MFTVGTVQSGDGQLFAQIKNGHNMNSDLIDKTCSLFTDNFCVPQSTSVWYGSLRDSSLFHYSILKDQDSDSHQLVLFFLLRKENRKRNGQNKND